MGISSEEFARSSITLQAEEYRIYAECYKPFKGPFGVPGHLPRLEHLNLKRPN